MPHKTQNQTQESRKQKVAEREKVMNEKLQMVEHSSVFNLPGVMKKWKEALRRCRTGDLKLDISLLETRSETQQPFLDSIVQSMVDNLHQQDDQAPNAWKAHMAHLERLQALHDKQLMFVKQQWESRLQHIRSRIQSGGDQALQVSDEQQARRREMISQEETKLNTLLNQIKKIYTDSLEAYEESHQNRMSLLLKRDEMKNMTLDNHKALQKNIPEAERVKTLLSRKQYIVDLKNKDIKKVSDLENGIRGLKDLLTYTNTEVASVTEEVEAAKAGWFKKHSQLHKQKSEASAESNKRLTHLSMQNDAATEKLQTVLTKGEKILITAEVCQKLKVRHDKFFNPSSRGTADRKTETQETTMETLNTALLRKEALKKLVEEKKQENERLRTLLVQHAGNMSARDQKLNTVHAISQCRGPARAAPPARRTRR